MPELPSGTVTFVFSDIEGSTKLLHELGDAYAEALAAHREIMRAAFSEHGGVEVDTQGDAFFAAFARASDAVAAAAEIQSRLAPGPVRVRIGVHTGEPQITDEGYVGLDVHRGARVCSAGHGGQVLLSQTTRDLVEAEATDLGEHRLKDLLEPQRLFQLGSGQFPPLKTLDWTNLPVQTTPLIGRERELAEAGALLREQRLLTVVGAPGAGKTRLALQLAADAADEFENVWWVGLQQIRDVELVEPTIAQAVGAKGDLPGYLRDRRALLLLDNVEQLLGYAPRLAELLADTNSLKVLTTSREPLRLTIEQQYPVPPLPDEDAASLFAERARAVRPDFASNGAVAEICRRLDGLPLAIELAAALVKLLPPDALLERLEQRLTLLTGGARDLPERQKTLRATIEWSYELLEVEEQELMARLSVFAGGWSLGAAEAICDAELGTLAALVDKSLVRERDGRFSMLQTIREYALERLAEHDPEGELARRHSAYFLSAAEERAGRIVMLGPTSETVTFFFNVDFQPGVADWFVAEQDNLRSALDWFHGQPDPAAEFRLVVACIRFWYHHGYWTEARRRLDDALGRAGGVAAELRVRALLAAANFSWRQGDFARGKAFAEEARSLVAQHGVPGSLAASLALANCEQFDNPERAIELYESALRQARADGDDIVSGVALGNLGNIALNERDLVSARAYIEESAALHRRSGQQGTLANDLIDLGTIALAENRRDAAATAFRESLALCRAVGSTDILLWAVEGLAAVALDHGDAVKAVRLLAAMTRPRAELGLTSDFFLIGDEMRERTLQNAREQLGEGGFAGAWEEGEGLSLEEAGGGGFADLERRGVCSEPCSVSA
jgi:predicted ATPase